jgi:pyroglutamyl-peptidase
MRKIKALVIGFGPFPGVPVNPSAALVRSLGHTRRPVFSDTEITPHILPTNYSAVDTELPALIRKHDPDIVLMFGLAGRTKHLRVETQAIHARSLIHPDADAKTPLMRAPARGPARLKSAAPIAAMIAAARAAGVNANASNNAGRYICNASLYACLDLRRVDKRPGLVAFVHIPWPRKPLRAGKRKNRARPTARMLQQQEPPSSPP